MLLLRLEDGRDASVNRIKILILSVAVAGLAAGLAAPAFGLADWRAAIWGASSAIVLAALLAEIARSLPRGEVGLDLVASLSMATALAFGETLAGAVVSLMYAGGQVLEEFAVARARTEMRALLERAPKRALRYHDGELENCAIDVLRPGDRLLIRQGDVIPTDGVVHAGAALLDFSALTGESVPVRRMEGEEVLSGAASLDMAFEMIVGRTAAESAYSSIVALVKAAQDAKAPLVRLADRYAVGFLFLTLVMAAAAYLATGDHLRILAVLVVATPCPLILAVPVALMSGLSRAAGRGVLLKGGPVLERLSRAHTLVIDKTGTLTHGHAELSGIAVHGGHDENEVLRLAASLDQASGHVIAASITAAARHRHLALTEPAQARETAGEGIAGRVGGHRVIVGGPEYVRRKLGRARLARPQVAAGTVTVAVAIDGKLAGYLFLADSIRPEARGALAAIRRAGIANVVLASGDAMPVVARIATELGIAEAHGELSPEDKVRIVLAERQRGPVIMAGDGVNDAPALAAADIGIAMGVRGSPASSEAADAVLLSVTAMLAAAFGQLPPVQGALVQEAIDLAVILNALRALR